MKVLFEESKAELVIKNSRFISEVFPVETQVQAREKLHEVKQKYFDATHVVHAFSVGLKSETFGMSDDGEPSGTAGRFADKKTCLGRRRCDAWPLHFAFRQCRICVRSFTAGKHKGNFFNVHKDLKWKLKAHPQTCIFQQRLP